MSREYRNRSRDNDPVPDLEPASVGPGKVPRSGRLPSGSAGVIQARAAWGGDAIAGEPIQRKAGSADARTASSSASVSGRRLPEAVQAKMENAFGSDFSAVRIHEGDRARAMGALAYTQGTDLHFAPGQYEPDTQRGQELIGHELAHVVQQSSGRVSPTVQAKGLALNDDAGLEREADECGAKAARGESVGLRGVSPRGSDAGPVQRKLMIGGTVYGVTTDPENYLDEELKEEEKRKLKAWLKSGNVKYTFSDWKDALSSARGAISRLDKKSEETSKSKNTPNRRKERIDSAQDKVDKEKLKKIRKEEAEKRERERNMRERQEKLETMFEHFFSDTLAKDANSKLENNVEYYYDNDPDTLKHLIKTYGEESVVSVMRAVSNVRPDVIRERLQHAENIFYHLYDPKKKAEEGDLQDFANKAKAEIETLIEDNPELKRGNDIDEKKGEKTKACMQLVMDDGSVVDSLDFQVFVSGGRGTSDYRFDDNNKRTGQGVGNSSSANLKSLTFEVLEHSRKHDTEVKILEQTLDFLKKNKSYDPKKMTLRVFVSRYTCASCSDLFYRGKKSHQELKDLKRVDIVYTDPAF